MISAYLSQLNIKIIIINNPGNTIGKFNKEEIISPRPGDLYNYTYKMKDYFLQNNPKKYTLVILDLIIIFFIFIFFILFLIIKSKYYS